MLSLDMVPESFDTLFSLYAHKKDRVQFGQFMAICAFLLLSYQVMQKMDVRQRGLVWADYSSFVLVVLQYV